jgi:hypothetical protein
MCRWNVPRQSDDRSRASDTDRTGRHAHSIIPTLQDGPLGDRDDGVVKYRSAHIDWVDSEAVIEHQDHSTQSNPLAVREVRRILMEELGQPERARGERWLANAPAPEKGN